MVVAGIHSVGSEYPYLGRFRIPLVENLEIVVSRSKQPAENYSKHHRAGSITDCDCQFPIDVWR
jgi:hypothetical protein